VPELFQAQAVDNAALLLENGGGVREDGGHRITRFGTELIEFAHDSVA